MMKRAGYKMMTWWLPDELIARIVEYQFQHRHKSVAEAARALLERGLTSSL
jgi:hypothetical protein